MFDKIIERRADREARFRRIQELGEATRDISVFVDRIEYTANTLSIPFYREESRQPSHHLIFGNILKYYLDISEELRQPVMRIGGSIVLPGLRHIIMNTLSGRRNHERSIEILMVYEMFDWRIETADLPGSSLS